MHRSVASQLARKPPKGRERIQTFAELGEEFGFDEYVLHAYAKQFGPAWLSWTRPAIRTHCAVGDSVRHRSVFY